MTTPENPSRSTGDSGNQPPADLGDQAQVPDRAEMQKHFIDLVDGIHDIELGVDARSDFDRQYGDKEGEADSQALLEAALKAAGDTSFFTVDDLKGLAAFAVAVGGREQARASIDGEKVMAENKRARSLDEALAKNAQVEQQKAHNDVVEAAKEMRAADSRAARDAIQDRIDNRRLDRGDAVAAARDATSRVKGKTYDSPARQFVAAVTERNENPDDPDVQQRYQEALDAIGIAADIKASEGSFYERMGEDDKFKNDRTTSASSQETPQTASGDTGNAAASNTEPQQPATPPSQPASSPDQTQNTPPSTDDEAMQTRMPDLNRPATQEALSGFVAGGNADPAAGGNVQTPPDNFAARGVNFNALPGAEDVDFENEDDVDAWLEDLDPDEMKEMFMNMMGQMSQMFQLIQQMQAQINGMGNQPPAPASSDNGNQPPRTPDNNTASPEQQADSPELMAARIRLNESREELAENAGKRSGRWFGKLTGRKLHAEQDELRGRFDKAAFEVALNDPKMAAVFDEDSGLSEDDRATMLRDYTRQQNNALGDETGHQMNKGLIARGVDRMRANGMSKTVATITSIALTTVATGGVATGLALGGAIATGLLKGGKHEQENRGKFVANLSSSQAAAASDEFRNTARGRKRPNETYKSWLKRVNGVVSDNFAEQFETGVTKRRQVGLLGAVGVGTAWGVGSYVAASGARDLLAYGFGHGIEKPIADFFTGGDMQIARPGYWDFFRSLDVLR